MPIYALGGEGLDDNAILQGKPRIYSIFLDRREERDDLALEKLEYGLETMKVCSLQRRHPMNSPKDFIPQLPKQPLSAALSKPSSVIDRQGPDAETAVASSASSRALSPPASSLLDRLPLHRLAPKKGIDLSALENNRAEHKLSVSIMIAMPLDRRHLDGTQSGTEGAEEEEELPELVVGCTESRWSHGDIL